MEQFKSFQDYPKTEKQIPMDKKFFDTACKQIRDEVNKRSYQNYIATGKIAGYIR